MNKRISIILTTLLFLATFVACASDSVLETTQNSISMENTRSDVNLGETVFFEAGTWINIELTSSRGSVDISITSETGNTPYNMEGLEDASHSVQITESAYYTIRIIGNNHTGQIRLSW